MIIIIFATICAFQKKPPISPYRFGIAQKRENKDKADLSGSGTALYHCFRISVTKDKKP
jgi:hypothetical protein